MPTFHHPLTNQPDPANTSPGGPLNILRVSRLVLLPLILILFALGLGQSTGVAEDSNLIHLPMITRGGTRWIGPDGGRVVSLAIDPSNPAVLYAGTWGAGVFKSTNAGETWSPVTSGLSNLFINSLAIDPVNPAVVYAGTYHDQVYKSTNGGRSWVWSGAGIQAEAIVYTIAIDPTNTNTIYIGTRGISNNGLPPWNGVIYKSIDAGKSWIAVLKNVGGVEVQDWAYSIVVNPQNPGNVYAAMHEHGAYRSNNYGAYWFPINDGITDPSGRAILVDWHAEFPYTLYLGVWHDYGVFRSVNNGAEWELTSDSIRGIAIYGMSMDPIDPDIIYLASFTHGVMRTTDSGETWASRGLPDEGIFAVAINPELPSTLYAGTAGNGIFRSQDSGVNWAHSQAGLRNADVVSVVAPGTPDLLYAALFGGGVSVSSDGGGHWAELNTGLTDKYVLQMVSNPAQPEVLFALTQTGGLFRNDTRTEEGWVTVNADLPAATQTLPVLDAQDPRAMRDILLSETLPSANIASLTAIDGLLSMVFDPSNHLIVYLGTQGSGIYKSTDGGLSWSASGLDGFAVRSIAIDPDNADTLYAVTNDAGFVKVSSDGGQTWQAIAVDTPSAYSAAVAQDGSGALYLGTSLGVMRYTSSTGWQSAGLNGLPALVLYTHPDHPELLFAGTDDGGFYTLDGGAFWRSGPAELSGLTVQSITCSPIDPRGVYFGTLTHGILHAWLTLTSP